MKKYYVGIRKVDLYYLSSIFSYDMDLYIMLLYYEYGKLELYFENV